MSPHCQHCGAFVTAAFVRVFAPEGADAPRVCPHCEDKTRDDNGRPRDIRGTRQGRYGRGPA